MITNQAHILLRFWLECRLEVLPEKRRSCMNITASVCLDRKTLNLCQEHDWVNGFAV